MKPAPFDYHRPGTLPEALELLGRLGDEAKLLAGGQSMIPVLAMRLSRFDHLIDLQDVQDLSGIAGDGASIRIGAMTRQSIVERSAEVATAVPLLSRAVPLIGHFQTRNRGTVGGSLAHADPAAELPAVASVLDATLEATGPGGTRRIAAGDFYVSTWTTVLEPEEILVAVEFPVWPGECGFAVREVARRHHDFATAGVACATEVAGGRVVRAAIGFFGMGPAPVRAAAAERAATGVPVAELDLEDLARLAVDDLEPSDDIHASALQRKRIGKALAREAVASALKEAQHG